ncbi:glyoxylase-like metal-dependent hydrolase (beta-lactamase superfamily II) [Actinomycetospora succinea]|uniref:Glyoxylase-like metal-dependent hydrolase (Beta-lactamase superfamily II) n=1 Tax=Actinomycetospora succinea TaxID=663603 RepID=A0A4R6VM65_9PSEU|nr:MBL fold metallo-hydrolase [Actinomycetospora succinea]TDQ63032.1 glyoxylase-like metal-dependent hydrolase (beta-lactamase superfamily II) [Actinomycetospora succinea]
MSWFHARPVARDVWLVAEPGHVNSWLVAGRDRAVLVDSGLGIAPIRPVVAALTDRPIDVLHTHAHFDHVGGDAEFDRVAIHPAGVAELRAGADPAERARYLAYTRRMLAAAGRYRALDHEFFHLLSADSDPRPLPPDVDATWAPGPAPEPDLLTDGDEIDLGGRTLRVLHTPGHTPDSVCFLDEHDGLLLAGDTVNTGPIYAQAPESDLAAFAASTARLAELDVRLVLMAHFGRGVAEGHHVREVADAFARLRAGDAVVRPARDCDDDPVREAVFDACSIYVPADG